MTLNLEIIQQSLVDGLEGCEIKLASEGNHLTVTAIGSIFEGKRALQRQRLVYAILNDYIAEGTVHAVNMNVFTPSEWKTA